MKKSIIRYSYACLAQDGLCNHPKGSYVFEGRITLQNSVRGSKIPGISRNLAKIPGILPNSSKDSEIDIVSARLFVLEVTR